MTPSEKAFDLFTRMKGFRVKHSHSKKCALIAVQEILDAFYHSESEKDLVIDIEYYTEVQKELTKLKTLPV